MASLWPPDPAATGWAAGPDKLVQPGTVVPVPIFLLKCIVNVLVVFCLEDDAQLTINGGLLHA